MFRTLEGLLGGYDHLSRSTVKMTAALTDDNRNQPVAEVPGLFGPSKEEWAAAA